MSILAQIHYAATVQSLREVLEEIARKIDQGEPLTKDDRHAISIALREAEGV